jgi:hypothetical protein
MPDDTDDQLGEAENFQWTWNGFDMIASVATDRGTDMDVRIAAALATGSYRAKPGSQQLSSDLTTKCRSPVESGAGSQLSTKEQSIVRFDVRTVRRPPSKRGCGQTLLSTTIARIAAMSVTVKRARSVS